MNRLRPPSSAGLHRPARRAFALVLALAAALLGAAALQAQVPVPETPAVRVQKVGQAPSNDIDRAAAAFDDAFRQALREVAGGLVLPGQNEKLSAFVAALTREHTAVYCTLAEPLGTPSLADTVFKQESVFVVQPGVLNRHLALASVGVKSAAGLAPPHLFLALQDKWNSSGEKADTWIIDKQSPSRQQVSAILRDRYKDFRITEDNAFSDDAENRDALLVKANNAGARLLVMGRMRSHQVVSATAAAANTTNTFGGGLTANQNSDPLKKANEIQLVISRPRIGADVEWQIFDAANGNNLLTIKARRDPSPNDPSELADALRAAKTALVNEKIDQLWMALLTWDQKSTK